MPTDLVETVISSQKNSNCLRHSVMQTKAAIWAMGASTTFRTRRLQPVLLLHGCAPACREAGPHSNQTTSLAVCLIWTHREALQYQVHVELKEIIKCNLIPKHRLLLIKHSCRKHLGVHSIVSEVLETGKIKNWWRSQGERENLNSPFQYLETWLILQVYFLFQWNST